MAHAKLRPRRGTRTEWELVDPILFEGEMGIEFPDTGIGTGLCKFKLGDGFKKWSELPYAFDASSAQSIYGGNVLTHNDIFVRSDTSSNWEAENPVLGIGEICYDITKQAIKVGDGYSTWKESGYIGLDFQGDLEWDFGDLNISPDPIGPDDTVTDFGDIGVIY